jgi:hypothetical protein
MSTITPIELKGREIFKIKAIASGQNLPYAKDSKLAGQTFNQYLYNGIVFTANVADDFVTWKNNGKLYSVDLLPGTYVNDEGETVKSLQLAGCTNMDQEKSMAQVEADLNKIYRDASPVEVSEDLLASLQQA